MHAKMGSSRRFKQRANDGKVANSSGSRFAPCPVCGRNIAIALVHEHLNTCLSTPEKATTVAASLAENSGAESNQDTCVEDNIGKRGAGEVDIRHNAANLLNVEPSSKKQKVLVSSLEGGQVQRPDRELGEASGGRVSELSHLQRTSLEARSKRTREGQDGLATKETGTSDRNFYGSAVSCSNPCPKYHTGVSEGNLRPPETPGLAEVRVREGAGQLRKRPLLIKTEKLPVDAGLDSVPEHQDIPVGIDRTAETPEDNEIKESMPKVIAPIFKKPNKVVYLIRHGNTMTNSGAAFRPFNIQEETGSEVAASGVAARTDSSGRIFDVPLSPLGLKQAAALQKKLPELKAEVILVSPLTRALQTCQEALGSLQVPVEVTSRHAEHVACCGDVGRPPSVLATEFPAFDLSRVQSVWWYSPAGAPNHALSGTFLSRESMGHLRERVQRFRAYLLQRPERTLVVIGHSTFFRELLGSKRRMAHCEIVQLRL